MRQDTSGIPPSLGQTSSGNVFFQRFSRPPFFSHEICTLNSKNSWSYEHLKIYRKSVFFATKRYDSASELHIWAHMFLKIMALEAIFFLSLTVLPFNFASDFGQFEASFWFWSDCTNLLKLNFSRLVQFGAWTNLLLVWTNLLKKTLPWRISGIFETSRSIFRPHAEG